MIMSPGSGYRIPGIRISPADALYIHAALSVNIIPCTARSGEWKKALKLGHWETRKVGNWETGNLGTRTSIYAKHVQHSASPAYWHLLHSIKSA